MSTISAGTSNTTSLVYTGDTTGNLAFQINGTTEAMRITSGGNVGVGTTSPEKNFDILVTGSNPTSNLQVRANRTGYGNVRAGLSVYAAGSSSTDITTLVNEGGVLAFQTGSTERMRIKSTGAVVVGKTTESGMATGSSVNMGICLNDSGNPGILTIQENTDANLYLSKASGYSSGIYTRFYVTGTQVGKIESNGSSTSYVTSSDYRLKENITPMIGALAKIALLKPVTYKWKANGSASEGFIAHELQEVCPEAVSGKKDAVNKNGDIEPQGVDTSFLVATLIAAIQELNAKVDAQAAEIAALKGNN